MSDTNEIKKILTKNSNEIYSFIEAKLDKIQSETGMQVELNIGTTTRSEIGNPVVTTVISYVELDVVLQGRRGYYS